LHSAYPDGRPAGASAPPGPQPAPLKESAQAGNVIVVADTDLLADTLWVQSRSLFGQRFAQAMASNGDFVGNAVDNLTGSSALISIRGRASFVRPFDRVEALRQHAEDRFRLKERELEEQLRNTEQKLTELQSRRSDQSSLILSPEQEKELESFQQEKLRVRRELREVRHGLDEDIDHLGNVIKVINILVPPLVVCALAAFVFVWRRRKLAPAGPAATGAAEGTKPAGAA
jgi:ABC-type uncharacterized transport system involved in gliding motility auxiliary subunit